jgi:hypothetical protein
MLLTVLTLYERGGGKVAKHGLVFESSSIGSVSYIPMQIWKHHHQSKFRAACGPTRKLNLPRYAHVPAAAFLHIIPNTMVKEAEGGEFLELSRLFNEDVYVKLSREKAKIMEAVRKLVGTRRNDDADVASQGA